MRFIIILLISLLSILYASSSEDYHSVYAYPFNIYEDGRLIRKKAIITIKVSTSYNEPRADCYLTYILPSITDERKHLTFEQHFYSTSMYSISNVTLKNDSFSFVIRDISIKITGKKNPDGSYDIYGVGDWGGVTVKFQSSKLIELPYNTVVPL